MPTRSATGQPDIRVLRCPTSAGGAEGLTDFTSENRLRVVLRRNRFARPAALGHLNPVYTRRDTGPRQPIHLERLDGAVVVGRSLRRLAGLTHELLRNEGDVRVGQWSAVEPHNAWKLE